MMKATEYVPFSSLGAVRFHENIEEFAKTLVTLGAISPEGSMPVAAIAAAIKVVNKESVDKKSIYNKLGRPGFVKVNNGVGSTHTFFYLFNDRFGDLARKQGAVYYPTNLGPLATERIPAVVDREFISRIVKTADIIGTFPSSAPNDDPIMVRAIHIDDEQVINGDMSEGLSKIAQMLDNPTASGTSLVLANTLVMLAGLERWVERFELLDIEKQTYIKSQIEKMRVLID